MTKENWIIGAIFKCDECDFEEQNYEISQKKAINHHKKTGHTVTGEITYCVVYKK